MQPDYWFFVFYDWYKIRRFLWYLCWLLLIPKASAFLLFIWQFPHTVSYTVHNTYPAVTATHHDSSSKIRIWGSATKARAMARSWRCPWLIFPPDSLNIVSKPCGSRSIISLHRLIFTAASISFKLASPFPYFRLFKTVSENKTVSCNTIATFLRRASLEISLTSCWLIKIFPPVRLDFSK